MANYPQPIKNHGELNLRLGIKSSLSQLPAMVASLYIIYKVSEIKTNVVYCKERTNAGNISLSLDDTLKIAIETKYSTEICNLIESSPLFKSQLEALQVGIELFFRLGKINFVNSGLTERTGANRYKKEITFSTNMVLLDLFLSSQNDTVINDILQSWLNNEVSEDTEIAKKICIMLNTFTEETQFKIRDEKSKEIIFNQEGVYAEILENEEVTSNDAKEPVGPLRIYKSYLNSGLHPYLHEKKQIITRNTGVSLEELKAYTNAVSTTLSLIPKRIIITQETTEKDFKENTTHPQKYPLQKITYGAPGTGKSHGTNEVVRNYKDTVRTTFHPDSDYSTFVGSYKPTTTEEFMYGLNGGNTVRYEFHDKPLKTSKIEYKFIPQAFIKAYIQAWKKMAKMTIATHATTGRMPTILECSGKPHLSWKITEIKGQDIYLESCYKLKIEEFKNSSKELWDKAWESGTYDQTIFTSFQRHEQTVCNWIYQNLENNNFEEGWDKFIAELNNGILELKVDPFTTRKVKTFYYHIDGDNIIINANLHTTQDAIGTCFEQEKDPTNFQQAVANCLRSYNQNNLEDAWQKLEEDLNNSGSHNSIDVEPQFLVIEEINRGNCAQIFGDLFQLLDRTKNGFSEYPIEADEDISKYIKEELKELAFNQEINDYINQQFVDGDMNPQTYDIDGKRVHVLEAILNGKILVLPSNLYIWATMNTSDQSLFPIDSAFKRRWDWEYKPIIKPADKNWKIQVGEEEREYDWWTFLTKVNDIINELTSSEDKKLGYFFAKAKKVGDEEVVDIDTMVNKVFFYLWNDVFKDYDLLGHLQSFPKIKEDTSKTDSKERPYSFGDFFDKKEGKLNKEAVEDFMKAFMPNTATTTTATATTTTATATTAAGTTPQEPTEQTTE